MGLKGSDKKQKKFLIDFRWEVHKFDNPEGFKPKQFLHFSEFSPPRLLLFSTHLARGRSCGRTPDQLWYRIQNSPHITTPLSYFSQCYHFDGRLSQSWFLCYLSGHHSTAVKYSLRC